MHRIDGQSATPQHMFTDGSPTAGVQATIVTDDWLNDIQENIARAIEGAGITLVKGDYTQLLQAISLLAGGAVASSFNTNQTGGIDINAGGGKKFCLRWVQFSLAQPVASMQNLVYSTALPTGALFALTTPFNAAFDQIGVNNITTTGLRVSKGASDDVARTGFVVVGGY